jgi:hypothetical protein
MEECDCMIQIPHPETPKAERIKAIRDYLCMVAFTSEEVAELLWLCDQAEGNLC